MTASYTGYNSGKHSSAKEERKVVQFWINMYRPTYAFGSGFGASSSSSLLYHCYYYYFFPSQMRKPLIERKRRERINNCLDQLKETVIGAFRLDVSIHPRVSSHHSHVNRLNQFHMRTRLSTAIQVGKGRYSGDDGETFAEHPEQQKQW